MIEDRIRKLCCWSGAVSIEPLAGGMTNRNYRVADANASYVVRICEEKRELAIDRRSERSCQEAAFRAGVAPEVVHHEEGVLVSRFIDASPLSADRLQDPATLARVGALLRQLHDARHGLTGEMLYFCPFQTVRTYAATARRLGACLPSDIDVHLADASRLAREVRPFHPTLCHNDLLPANIIDDGQALLLVDWEYAGMGNPLFDLASVSSNSRLSDDLEAVLLQACEGHVDEESIRQVRIFKTVSLLREALWAFIQAVSSNIDFDYEQYGAANLTAYQQARSELAAS